MPFDIPEAYQHHLANLLAAALIVIAAWVVHRLASRGLSLMAARKEGSELAAAMLRKVLRLTVIVVAVLLVLQRFGILENIWGVLSAVLAMVAIGFVAVWSVLSNVLCTVMLLLFKPFRVGDTVEVVGDGVEGKVIDLNLLFTTLRSGRGDLVQVPNNSFFQKIIRRRPAEGGLSLDEQLQRDRPTE